MRQIAYASDIWRATGGRGRAIGSESRAARLRLLSTDRELEHTESAGKSPWRSGCLSLAAETRTLSASDSDKYYGSQNGRVPLAAPARAAAGRQGFAGLPAGPGTVTQASGPPPQ
jgi:hypothetical protein